MLRYLLHPKYFFRLCRYCLPWVALLGTGCLGFGLYHVFVLSPLDYQQHDAVRIMYVHVPSAWLGLMLYAALALFSGVYLVMKNPFMSMLARAIAPVGCCFTLLCLVTGSLWGKPIWGTWWVWDARLTSMFILFLLYLGYMLIWHSFEHQERASYAASILALLGIINIPIIKFSVYMWHTLHQGSSVIKLGGPSIPSSMLTPLLLMFGAFLCYSILVVMLRSQVLFYKKKFIDS